MRLATWNVLHRIHAVNWHEPAIDAHPDEASRVAAIAARVAAIADVVCLQEVSGDQLAALQDVVAVHTYPRVPRLFRPGPMPLAATAEHLVVIAKQAARASRGHTFATDRGKGYLVVEFDGLTVIDTHVSYGNHHAAQCAELADVSRGYERVAILGDFNADRAVCSSVLTELAAAEPRAGLATRPRIKPSEKAQDIDHVFVRGLPIDDAAVVSGDGLSDHNPVVVHLSQNTRREMLKSP